MLFNARVDLRGITTNGRTLQTQNGIRVILVNRYESEAEYRKWAAIKWLRRPDFSDIPAIVFCSPRFTDHEESSDDLLTLLEAEFPDKTFTSVPYNGNSLSASLRMGEHIPTKGAGILVLLWGYDEAFEHLPLRDFERSLDLAIDCARDRNGATQVILAVPPPIIGETSVTETYAKSIRRIAREHHCPIIDLHAKLLSEQDWHSYYVVDDDSSTFGLYPSADGRRHLASLIAERLK